MPASIATEYLKFVAQQHTALPQAAVRAPLTEGQLHPPIDMGGGTARELLAVAMREAAGLYRPSTRKEVVWVDGSDELAVALEPSDLAIDDGVLALTLAVRCDQTGDARVRITFVCGSPDQPAGLFAATHRVPEGPALVVDRWGDALVAFAWQCVLGLFSGLAAAAGKDARGQVLVPVEVMVTAKGLTILPMARHRFTGQSAKL
jgi:hypothetical protein